MAKIPISGTFAVNAGKITFSPTEDLPSGALINVSLNTSIRGVVNQRLATTYLFSFTTEKALLEEQLPETLLEGNVGAMDNSMPNVDQREQLPEATLEANVGTLDASMPDVDQWEQLPETTLEATVGTMTETIA